MSEAGRVEVPIRDAASVILVRRRDGAPQVLMGQRGAAAVFMPDKFVFPGGALDAGDHALADAAQVDPDTALALAVDTAQDVARALPLAAVRELWEETGLRLGAVDDASSLQAAAAPPAWRGFLAGGLRPRTEALRFVFRAITPQGRPRRFDARFFLVEADALHDDPDEVTAGDGELRHLQWLDLAAARAFPVPFITGIVLSEIEATLADPAARRPAPYFRHDAHGSHFRMI